MKKITYILFALFLLSSINALSENKYKFGKVSEDDLKAASYDIDTSASAIILFDIGEFNPDEFRFCRTIRIKVLKKEGLYWANQFYPASDGATIRGKTYNIVNEKVETDKLKKESIFKERVTDNYYRYRVAMPNVKVGSVFEIQFLYQGKPPVWYFQYDVPNLHSELKIPDNSYVEFRRNVTGYITLDKSTPTEYIANNVPAFKREPYMTTPNNYRSKLTIDYLRVSFPGFYKEYTTTYNAVAKRLTENNYYGELIGVSAYLNDWVEEINRKSYSNDKEKITAAFEKVKAIKWDGASRLYAENTSLRTVYKDKDGNATEINLILLNLLRKLDYNAFPVVLSTRSNGLMSPIFPSWNKLNYTIVSVKIDDKEYLLDATDKYTTMGMLPKRCLNYYGLIFNNANAQIIDVKPIYSENESTNVKATITEDLTIECNETCTLKEYAARNIRADYEEAGKHDDYVKSLEESNTGMKIKSLSFTDLDSIYKPVKERVEYSVTNQAFEMDNEIFINPMLHYQIKENPFKIEKRDYPIEYGYPKKDSYMFYYTIPEGYTVSEIPKPINLTLPDNAALFLYKVVAQNNIVVVICKISINKDIYLPAEYPYIKQFYDYIVKKEAEPIVLKKL